MNGMKLNDVVEITGKLNWSKLDLYEIFNSTQLVAWKMVNSILNGSFSVDGEDYVIQLEPGTYKNYSFINVSFHKGNGDYELSLDTKRPAVVLGTIINGVEHKIDEFHYDALVFSAANNIDRRMSFYNRLAQKFVKRFARIQMNVETPSGKLTVLISKTVTKEDVDGFIKSLEVK